MIVPQLNLRQNQSLVMTPQLLQAIKVLKMTNLEVSSFIKKQVEQNPLLVCDEHQRTHDQALAVKNQEGFFEK